MKILYKHLKNNCIYKKVYMDYSQLIEVRKNKLQELEDIFNTAKAEERKMSNIENTAFENVKKELVELDQQIEEKNNEKNNINIINKRNNKMENRFSLIKSIRDYVEGRGASDATLSVLEAGKKEMSNAGISYRGQIILPTEYRAIINATTDSQGEYIVAEDKMGLLGALRENLVAVKAGANLLTGLKGDVSIPVYAGTSSLWKGENADAGDGAGAFSEVTMSPKRLTTYIDVSKMLLAQDGAGAEELLMNDLNESILAKLESTIFGSASGSTTQPAGIFYGVTNTSTGSTDWTKIVALETAVNTSNALFGKLAYVATPALMGKMKTTAKDSGSGIFIASEGTQVNGYPLYVSSAVAANRIVFGNFADLLIGSWGAIDITVDPYTQAGKGAVRLVVNSYWDVVKRRAASFAYGNLS
ncbi:MAG: phage major capsid protein [Bacteroidales bacterium]|nr:phage major capsid protein [Bacteroidales bacterium]